MNKLFLPSRVLTVSVSLLTFSCTKEQVQVVNEKTVATKAALGEDSLEESANSKYVIDEGMVRQYYSRTAPGKRILSIEPYTGSGAVPLYVVNFDENYNVIYRASTLEDMLTIYPGFIEGTYQPIITISRREYYRMNWGYNGRHDDGLYTIVPSSNWYNYSTQAAIHYDLYPGQLLIGN